MMKNKIVILIDNGHGINTKGKFNKDKSIMEYAYAREIAAEVVSRLQVLGYDARRLVTEYADIPLGQRSARANAVCDRVGSKNVLLVSIHLNASGNGEWMQARGWEAWTSPGQTNGDKLAECLYTAAGKHLPAGTKIRTDLTDGDRDKEARFAILTQTKCPACLTENLFMDNKEDAQYLLSKEGKEAIVQLHVDGIMEYVERTANSE